MNNDKFVLSAGQSHQLEMAFGRHGWNNAQVQQLCGGEVLANVRALLEGRAKLVFEKHLVNTDTDPFTPDGWKVEEHLKAGMLEWSPEKIKLFLSEHQEADKRIEGNELRKELKGKPALNANVLDYLLKHPELIPEEWKGKAVFFWGTIYRGSGGFLYVRYLRWGGNAWSWDSFYLVDGLRSHGPAALSAS